MEVKADHGNVVVKGPYTQITLSRAEAIGLLPQFANAIIDAGDMSDDFGIALHAFLREWKLVSARNS